MILYDRNYTEDEKRGRRSISNKRGRRRLRSSPISRKGEEFGIISSSLR